MDLGKLALGEFGPDHLGDFSNVNVQFGGGLFFARGGLQTAIDTSVAASNALSTTPPRQSPPPAANTNARKAPTTIWGASNLFFVHGKPKAKWLAAIELTIVANANLLTRGVSIEVEESLSPLETAVATDESEGGKSSDGEEKDIATDLLGISERRSSEDGSLRSPKNPFLPTTWHVPPPPPTEAMDEDAIFDWEE